MPTPTFYTAGPTIAGGAVHPTKPWYYVTNSGWGTVSQNTIGTNGMLSAMTPSIVATQNNPNAIAIDPSGKWAYVANGNSNCVSQFNIDQTTGVLTSMSTPTVATGGYNAWDIKIVSIPSGTYAYVANYGGNGNNSNAISQYSIGANGALSPLTPATVSVGGTYSLSIAVHPTGKFAYVPIFTSPSGVIAQFQINQTTGVLVSNGTASTAQSLVDFVAIESSGKYAYATSGDNGSIGTTISQYTIDQTTGALTLMSNPSVQTGMFPGQIVTVGK